MTLDLPTVVFGCSLLFVAYVLVGYPVVLAAICALRGRRDLQRGTTTPTVTVLLPARNGARWMPAKLQTLAALDYPHDLLQIVVIDDGSTDETAAMVERCGDTRVELVRVPRGGKPAALNAGLTRARGEILFFTDVRQPLDPGCLRSLVSWFTEPTVGVVSGELVIMDGQRQQEADIGLYWRYEKWIRRRLSQLHSVIGATGCIYAMRRDLARPLPPETLVDDMHLPLGAFFRGYRILFDEGARAFDYPTALDSEFNRKVRTLAGNYQILRAYPRLLLPTHPMWLHFVSHKLARLFLPFALMAVALATPFLPVWMAVPAAVGQLVVYGLAALDTRIPDKSAPKRLSSPARTFVIMMLAAAKAAWVAATGHRQLWTETQVTGGDRLRPV